MASQHSFSFNPVAAGLAGEDARSAMRDMVGDGEFFSISLPDGSRLLHSIPRSEKHPISFGREVLAQLVGEPGRYSRISHSAGYLFITPAPPSTSHVSVIL